MEDECNVTATSLKLFTSHRSQHFFYSFQHQQPGLTLQNLVRPTSSPPFLKPKPNSIELPTTPSPTKPDQTHLLHSNPKRFPALPHKIMHPQTPFAPNPRPHCRIIPHSGLYSLLPILVPNFTFTTTQKLDLFPPILRPNS